MTAIVPSPEIITPWTADRGLALANAKTWRGEQKDDVPVFDKGHTIVADPAARAGLAIKNQHWAQDFPRNAADRRPARINVTAALMGDPRPGRGQLGGGR